MMRSISCTTLILGSLVLAQSLAQPGSSSGTLGLEPGEYPVGFRLLDGRDYSRSVTGQDSAFPRPIRTYLWYPADSAEDGRKMRFGQYVSFADDDIWPAEIVGSIRENFGYSNRPFARSLDGERFELLLQRSVLAIENANSRRGSFPLIVIGQGLYYESPIAFALLAEYLAGRGFVVATAPLAGTNSPLVKLDARDLESQVRDLEYIIGQVRQFPYVSPERLGVFGFDMGGMAGLILAMRNRDVDAFMSVDSGVLYPHPSGIPAASPDFDASALRIPWLSISQPLVAAPPAEFEGQSLFEQATFSHRYLLIADGMQHVDFTSYALVEGRSAMAGYWQASVPDGAAAHRRFADYVYDFFAAFLDQSAESLAFISRDPGENFPASGMTLEHRAAMPASISYDRFVRDVIAGRATEAVSALRSAAATDPGHVLLEEFYLGRLVASLLNTWGLADEVIPVIEFMDELYPSAESFVPAQVLLAEAEIMRENYSAAADVYRDYLEANPGDIGSQSRLDWLLSQMSEAREE